MPLYKESEGGRLIFSACNLVEYHKPGCLTYGDYNSIHECVRTYDIYLAKHTKKSLSKFDKMTKERVKESLYKLIRIGTDKEEKYKLLSSIIYILTNFKQAKEREEEIMRNKMY
tara:strand:+ start:1083 stop:1424 length:342 start_codon:yes stop_codon:yes gene_type:complete